MSEPTALNCPDFQTRSVDGYCNNGFQSVDGNSAVTETAKLFFRPFFQFLFKFYCQLIGFLIALQ